MRSHSEPSGSSESRALMPEPPVLYSLFERSDIHTSHGTLVASNAHRVIYRSGAAMCRTVMECERPTTDMEIRLDSGLEAPGEARAFIRGQLAELGYPKFVDNGAVVVSELVTNAI